MMPAGTYYSGDLCYVMTDEEWDAVEDLTNGFRNDGEFEFVDKRRFSIYHTAHGDGTYEDQFGVADYPVDSGSIGCFKLEHIQYKSFDSAHFDCGNLVTFKEPFETRYDDGKIYFGKLFIDTDSDYAEEWYDEDEEEDENNSNE